MVPFVSLVLELSLYSLSLTLGHFEFSWSTLALDQEKKRKMKCNRLHVRRKMKKMEASLIKILMRSNWQAFAQTFVSSVLELYLYSLSHTHSWTQSSLGAFQHWTKKRENKKSKDKGRKGNQISSKEE